MAITMPCNSKPEDKKDAELVAKTFGVKTLNIDLSNALEELKKETHKSIIISEEAEINIKPRLRMTTLYAVAQTLNYLVIGTGNLSEAFVGYTTKWGDSACDLNPIGNFTVEEVLQIGKFIGVPDKIINKAPNDGLTNQTDEEKMGVTYEQIEDVILTGNTDSAETTEKILRMNKISEHKRNSIKPATYKKMDV